MREDQPATCLVPEPNGQTGDFFAWRPDSLVPSANVQTALA